MGGKRRVLSSYGVVPGPYKDEVVVCQYIHLVDSRGFAWSNDDPFSFSLPLLLAQLAVIVLATRITFFFLKPLKQSMVSAQLIAGILLGPSFLLSKSKIYAAELFPPQGRLVLETVANVGFMIHLFLLGVQIDASLVKKAGRTAILIGTVGSFLAYLFAIVAVFVLSNLLALDDALNKVLPVVAFVNSSSAFPVIASLLGDLKILNSELGRMATSASMVCDFCSYCMGFIMGTIGLSVRYSSWRPLSTFIWVFAFLMIVLFAFRPLMNQIANQIVEGQSMKEIHFLSIIVVVLLTGLLAEVLGQPAALGTFVLGLAVPDGPPLGTALVHKLDIMSTGILIPAKFAISGLTTNVFTIRGSTAVVTECVILLGYVGKLTGTFIPAIYCDVPFTEAVSLALIMCCRGIIEASAYIIMKDLGVISDETYALMIITMLIITGLSRPIIWYLYDPSVRYTAERRNNIVDADPEEELRILVCIHKEDNVPTIINLLELTKPTRKRPICVYVLNLLELTGRSAAILVPNFLKPKLTPNPTRSGHIINAFNFFVQQNHGLVTVQHFTAMAPYVSMHDDVCTIALDKNAHIIIVPFHKQWTIGGSIGHVFPSLRTVNRSVMQKAPCSVGILVDRGQMGGGGGGGRSIYVGPSLFRIAVLFIGGADDREALSYAARMAEHSRISLTVVWLRWSRNQKNRLAVETDEKALDMDLINLFRANHGGKKRVIFKEESAKDAVGTTRLLRSMEDSCDLFVVGRHQVTETPLTMGLMDWSECPELGVIGDMLATSDFRFSVLVVQQQPPAKSRFRAKKAERGRGGGGVAESRVCQDSFEMEDKFTLRSV